MSYSKSILAFFVLLLPAVIHAQTKAPDSLSFQGRLTDPGGVPIDTPSVSMTFKLYEGGVEIWSETHPGVTVVDGVFNVLLGGTTPLNTIAFNAPLELGITVGDDPEISPRTPLAAAAYAKALPGLYTFMGIDGNSQSYNLIGGGLLNSVDEGVVGATIGGGGGLVLGIPAGNFVSGDWGTVGGGANNDATGLVSTVGGGLSNGATGQESTIGGGFFNETSGTHSTIAGGTNNEAAGQAATVGGGDGNEAAEEFTTVGGGNENRADGSYATVPGGRENRAGSSYTLAAGYNARAIHTGSFVWNDRSQTQLNLSDSLFTTADNQFLIRAAGGVGIGTNAPTTQLSVLGNADIGDSLGVGTSELEAPLHVQINDLDVGAGELARDGIIVEKDDAVIGAYSGPGGTWGSALVLAEMNNDLLTSKWALVRETNTFGNDLHFKYGSDDLYEANATQFEIRNTGEAVTSGNLLPDTDDAYSLGQNGLVWTEVFASSGVVSTSDRRLKEDIRELSFGLEEVLRLEPVSYHRRDRRDSRRELGLIAQEVEAVIPAVVRPPNSEEGYYGLNYAQLVPVLIKAIQEQQVRINDLEELVARFGPSLGTE